MSYWSLIESRNTSALTFDLRVFVGDVETSVRVKSDLNFAIFKRFKEEKFLDAPAPNATKVEIVRFENLGSSPHYRGFLSGEPAKARRAGTMTRDSLILEEQAKPASRRMSSTRTQNSHRNKRRHLLAARSQAKEPAARPPYPIHRTADPAAAR